MQPYEQHEQPESPPSSPVPSPPSPSNGPCLPLAYPPIRVGRCVRQTISISQDVKGKPASRSNPDATCGRIYDQVEVFTSPLTGRSYCRRDKIYSLPDNHKKPMEIFLCDEYVLVQGHQCMPKEEQKWVSTGVTVVMKACKLKAGEEEGLSMYNQRPKIFTFSGDEPVEELKAMVYVTSHLESDRSILGEHAVEQVGIVPLLDAFMDAQHNHVCTIVPYYENKDAFEVMMSYPDRCLSEDVCRGIFIRTLHALNYLKLLGIAHLDISIENLFMDKQGQSWLGDMGMALRVDPLCPTLQGHRFRGKPHYSPLEKLEGRAFDPFTADMFSLGATLFTMLTGQHYLEGPGDAKDWRTARLRTALATRDFATIFQRVSGVVDPRSDLADLIAGMTDPDPNCRLTLEEVWKHPWVCGGGEQ